jgi:hypothetical protein
MTRSVAGPLISSPGQIPYCSTSTVTRLLVTDMILLCKDEFCQGSSRFRWRLRVVLDVPGGAAPHRPWRGNTTSGAPSRYSCEGLHERHHHPRRKLDTHLWSEWPSTLLF